MDLKETWFSGTSEKQRDNDPLFIRMLIKFTSIITLLSGLLLSIIMFPVLGGLLLVHIIFAVKHKRDAIICFVQFMSTCITIPLCIYTYLLFDPITGLYHFFKSRFNIDALTETAPIFAHPITTICEMVYVLFSIIGMFIDYYIGTFKEAE